MQDLLQRDLGALQAPTGQDLAELADALFVGAGGAAHVEVVAHHHDVAAVKSAGSHDVLDVLVVEEATDHGLDLVLLTVAAGSAGVGDDGAAAGDDGRVLDEAAVGELLESGQDRDVDAALLEGVLVVVVLLDGALVDGLAQLGCAGDAVAQRLTRAADDDMVELRHASLSLGAWLPTRIAAACRAARSLG